MLTDLWGQDIALSYDGQAKVAANGELILTDGVDTGVQDIMLRLFTYLGTLFYDSGFGSLIPDWFYKGLAHHLDDARADIIWLRDQWLVERADNGLLAAYGQSRGMPRFRFDTDESYRRRVVNAFVWHKLGGKYRGMERIFAENGLMVQVTDSAFPELWAHFRVVINITGLEFGFDALELSFWLANEFKPARSVLEGIWTWGRADIERFTAIASRSHTRTRPCLYFFPKAAPGLLRYMAASVLAHTETRPRLYFIPQAPMRLNGRPNFCASGFTRSRLAFHSQPPEISRQQKGHSLALAGMTRLELDFIKAPVQAGAG